MLILSLSEVLALNKLYFPLEVIVRLGGSTGETALARICGVSEKTARRWLVELTRLGYLERRQCHNGYVLTQRAKGANRERSPEFQQEATDIQEKLPEHQVNVPEIREEAPEPTPATADESHFNKNARIVVDPVNRERFPGFQEEVPVIQEKLPEHQENVPESIPTTTTSLSLNYIERLKAVVDLEDAENIHNVGEKIPIRAPPHAQLQKNPHLFPWTPFKPPSPAVPASPSAPS